MVKTLKESVAPLASGLRECWRSFARAGRERLPQS
jgi:hypothetical protein